MPWFILIIRLVAIESDADGSIKLALQLLLLKKLLHILFELGLLRRLLLLALASNAMIHLVSGLIGFWRLRIEVLPRPVATVTRFESMAVILLNILPLFIFGGVFDLASHFHWTLPCYR